MIRLYCNHLKLGFVIGNFFLDSRPKYSLLKKEQDASTLTRGYSIPYTEYSAKQCKSVVGRSGIRKTFLFQEKHSESMFSPKEAMYGQRLGILLSIIIKKNKKENRHPY